MRRIHPWLCLALCIVLPAVVQATPVIGTSPSSLAFGNVNVGQLSDLPLTIQNTGNSTLAVTSLTFSGSGASAYVLVSPPPLPINVAAGGSVGLTVRFQPATRGPKVATLTLSNTDPVTPNKAVSLTGTGFAPVLNLSTSSLNYGLVEVGTQADRTFIISNLSSDAGQNLAVFLSITGSDAALFTQVGPPGSSFSVNPGSSATITVRFAPNATGAKTAMVNISSNDPLNPSTSITLSGAGAVPTAALSPTSLSFGNVHTDVAVDQIIQVQNVGAGTLNVTGLAISGADASQFSLVTPPALPFSVPQGGNVPLTVRFRPTSAGNKAASLVVTSGPANDQTIASLTGVGIRPEPRIAGVRDVPNDQGGRVKLFWDASTLDQPGTVLDHYYVLRSTPPHTARGALLGPTMMRQASSTPGAVEGRNVFYTMATATDTIYWELIATIPAIHFVQGYSYVAETFMDSTATANPRTWFLVMALDASNSVHWDSAPDSGYSVDNLAPAAPTSFTATYTEGATHLHWQRNTESDLREYHLHRGTAENFVPSAGNLISAQPDTGFADPGPAGSYYKLSAVDVHDNQSPYVLLAPGTVTGVQGSETATLRFAPPWPNPSRGAMDLSFSLSRPGDAVLTVYDLEGRRVRELAKGANPAGERRVHWDGRDDAGRAVRGGVYFAKLDAEGRALSVRLTILN